MKRPSYRVAALIERIEQKRKTDTDENEEIIDYALDQCDQSEVHQSIQNLLTDLRASIANYEPRQDIGEICVTDPEALSVAMIDAGMDSDLAVILSNSCYHGDEPHPIHLITYNELLGLVWYRIDKSERKAEMVAALALAAQDFMCKCFIDMFHETLEVLGAFCDDINIGRYDSDEESE